MTKLFEEYETKRLAKLNTPSLVGKKFYWSTHPYTKDNLLKLKHNIFRIIEVETLDDRFYPERLWATYEYLYGGSSKATRLLDEILEDATPIDD